MSGPFDQFVILAGMRTGSNFLEVNLNEAPDVECFGEAFNPHFIGYPNRTEILGITQAQRDADPNLLLRAIGDVPGLGGFRFFRDHDPRVLGTVLDNPRCAKIVLTRNPLDSYVSWKIAQATGQWKLTNVKRRKEAEARFDTAEFAAYLDDAQDFQLTVLNRLQKSGQTAFYLAYEDLQDLDVLNGLLRWLGVSGQLESLNKSLKPQNPGGVESKVSNPEEIAVALSRLDRYNLTRTPNFEPRRGPSVPGYVLGAETPLIYMPVRAGRHDPVVDWLAKLDGFERDALETGLNQKSLRQWMRRHPGHRSFTVVKHPLARAHAAFCDRILMPGSGNYARIRETLRTRHKLPIPKTEPGSSYDAAAHRGAFGAFLEFLRANLAGQTPIRVDSAWCSQSQILSGFGELVTPDFVLRDDELDRMLPVVTEAAGRDQSVPQVAVCHDDGPVSLADIWDQDLEDAASEIYQRDYLLFGFGPWKSA